MTFMFPLAKKVYIQYHPLIVNMHVEFVKSGVALNTLIYYVMLNSF